MMHALEALTVYDGREAYKLKNLANMCSEKAYCG